MIERITPFYSTESTSSSQRAFSTLQSTYTQVDYNTSYPTYLQYDTSEHDDTTSTFTVGNSLVDSSTTIPSVTDTDGNTVEATVDTSVWITYPDAVGTETTSWIDTYRTETLQDTNSPQTWSVVDSYTSTYIYPFYTTSNIFTYSIASIITIV